MDYAFALSVVLVLGAIFVNGWTDAPNAIGSVVGTRVMSPNSAIFMAMVGNFLGVVLMTLISSEVADTISSMVTLTTARDGSLISPHQSLVALAAALLSIVIWSTGAWYFGIPSSESHALIAGLTGSAIALGGFASVSGQAWVKVIVGLGVSSVLGFGSGWVLVRLIEITTRHSKRSRAERSFHKLQIGAGALMAFLHGAQDGQKFMGVFMVALSLKGLASRGATGTFDIPFWVMLVSSLVMGLGTMAGGKRIIKTVGLDMVKMRPYQGFASDFAASSCLILASLTGLPVSTTHTKTTAVMGVAASRRVSSVDWGIARDMVTAWLLVFPGCGLIGYLMTKLFLIFS